MSKPNRAEYEYPMWRRHRDEDEHQSLVRLGVIQSFPAGTLLPTQGNLPDGKWAKKP